MHNSGGRKVRSTIDVVMLKYFTLGIMHMQRRNCAITDCDARACYDRILPAVLYFTYHKMGSPVHECKWLARALVNMNYHMITTYEPSEEKSTTTIDDPILGVGQGATDAYAGWLLVSTRLTEMYNKSSYGCKLLSPHGKLHLGLSHTMFVDDAYLFHAKSTSNEPALQLQQIVQQDVQEWDSGIEATGGKLNGAKTNYVIMSWVFAPDGRPYLESDIEFNSSVHLTTNNSYEYIKQISPNKHPKNSRA